MKINIYQINMDRDEEMLCFRNFSSITKKLNGQSIPADIFDRVFRGQVDCETLEDVYSMFNSNHPKGYTGRSLSVSDVVEVIDGGEEEPGYYYCDSVGFKRIDFEKDKVKIKDVTQVEDKGYGLTTYKDKTYALLEAPRLEVYAEESVYTASVMDAEGEEFMARWSENPNNVSPSPLNDWSRAELVDDPTFAKEEKLRVVALKPGKEAYETEIGNTLEDSQKFVGGYIECVYPFDSPYMVLVCNEEAKLQENWRVCRALKNEDGEIVDLLAGDAFVCGADNGNFVSLTDQQVDAIQKKFGYPEKIYRTLNGYMAVPYRERNTTAEKIEKNRGKAR